LSDEWETVSLMLIESVSHLEVPVHQRNQWEQQPPSARTSVKRRGVCNHDPQEPAMMPLRELVNHIDAEPFKPFQIHTASGRTFEVPHPEFIQVGRSTFTIYAAPENDPEGPQRWEKVSLMLVESIAPLNTSTRPQGA
jgi:hypothetical protein